MWVDARDEGSSTRRARVLVVDDEPLIRQAFSAGLRLAGFTVTTAPDGIAALERVEEGADVIVLDLDMPRLNGEGVLRELQASASTRDIPVIVVTGTRIASLPHARQVLQKPCSLSGLIDAVKDALRAVR